MKIVNNIIDKRQRTIWLRAFRIWQHKSYELAPLSNASCECSSCGTVFQGNFCPRCGQSAKVGRFSFKKALLLFIDVWGLGNRSMFRSIRDLMLRPGYMIRDYISGMQSAYFPPFKMFFLLTAFSLIVEHGFSLGLDDSTSQPEKPVVENTIETNGNAPLDESKEEKLAASETKEDSLAKDTLKEDSVVETKENELAEEKGIKEPVTKAGWNFVKVMDNIRKKNPAIFSLLSLVVFSLPLFLFFRSTPTIPDLRYSEFIVALVYTSNTYSIYSILGNLLNSNILKLIAVLMVFIALKQFSGFSKLRVLLYLLLTFLIAFVVFLILAILGVSYFVYLYDAT